jgi:hypothetical protein
MLSQRCPNNRASTRFNQLPRRRREFVSMELLMLLRALAGSSQQLIVFRKQEQEEVVNVRA